MKRVTTLIVAMFCLMFIANAQSEYKVITIIESIIPMGLGRSMMVEHTESLDHNKFSAERVEGKTQMKNIKRKDINIDGITETKLKNFYSGVGINFANIAANDALISSKINEMVSKGWELSFAFSGVESVGAKDDKAGIYITRLIFKK